MIANLKLHAINTISQAKLFLTFDIYIHPHKIIIVSLRKIIASLIKIKYPID